MPDIHTLYIGTFGSYVQISDDEQDDSYNLPDIHTMDIGIFGPYVKIADV